MSSGTSNVIAPLRRSCAVPSVTERACQLRPFQYSQESWGPVARGAWTSDDCDVPFWSTLSSTIEPASVAANTLNGSWGPVGRSAVVGSRRTRAFDGGPVSDIQRLAGAVQA